MRLAFFDFDNTVCRTDSIVPFLLYCIRHHIASPFQLVRAGYGWFSQRLLRHNVVVAKEHTLSFIRRKKPEELESICRGFLSEHIEKHLYPDAKQRMEAFRTEGRTVVVVSASTDIYMRFLPEFLPVDLVLCTQCQIESGHYTGKIGPNCRKAEKVHRIQAWLKGCTNSSVDWSDAWAFGDSDGDIEMLKLVGHPVPVNPSKKLQAALPDAQPVHWHES